MQLKGSRTSSLALSLTRTRALAESPSGSFLPGLGTRASTETRLVFFSATGLVPRRLVVTVGRSPGKLIRTAASFFSRGRSPSGSQPRNRNSLGSRMTATAWFSSSFSPWLAKTSTMVPAAGARTSAELMNFQASPPTPATRSSSRVRPLTRARAAVASSIFSRACWPRSFFSLSVSLSRVISRPRSNAAMLASVNSRWAESRSRAPKAVVSVLSFLSSLKRLEVSP